MNETRLKTGILAAVSLSALTAMAQDRPDIILIMTDQQRADALGCAGNASIITPNLDSLAADGYLFTNAYSSAPSSTPARAGLLTGMTPWHHGMLGYGNVAGHYRYEMPQMLRDCGYFTLGIGKMHWNPQNALHGFHYTILDESGRIESPYFRSDYRKWFASHAAGQDPDKTGLGWNDHGASEYKLEENLHPTVWTGNEAVAAIESYCGVEPLFLKVSFARPHSPYDPPRRVLDMYDGVAVPAPAKGEWSAETGKDVTDPEAYPEAAFAQFGDSYAVNSRRHYYAAVTFVDEQVGRIIDALKAAGRYDNALIVFVSDHGDMLGDHNHWRKTYAYEGSSAVPFIVKLPQSCKAVRAKGSGLEQPVELRDVLPTFLEAAGAPVPEDMDGRPVQDLLCREGAQWRRWIEMEHAECYSPDNYWCALSDGKTKYIRFFRSGAEQLFDLEKDPLETSDLAGDRKYVRRLKEAREAMADYLSERGEDWVKDGKLMIREKSLLYSPEYPSVKSESKGFAGFGACKVDIKIDTTDAGYLISGPSALSVPGHFVWGGSVAKADDGKYYMIYSAPETGRFPFNNAWVQGSKMGLAVSERPDGGFRHLGFFMNADGFSHDASSWDAQSVSNPTICRFDGKYYLYYAGTSDPGNSKVSSPVDTLARRDRLQQNQKIGVISFDSFPGLLEGKFTHSEAPLLAPRTRVKPDNVVDPSPEGTVAGPDNLIVVNPSVIFRKSDRKYLLYFKGNVYDPYWRGIHGVAVSDSPTGPFVAQDDPVFVLDGDAKLSAEDPYVWYCKADDRMYAVFKDFTGHYTKAGPCLAIMESDDGISWRLPENSLFMKKELRLSDGSTLAVERLERPQLLVDDNGIPMVLYAACAIDNVNPRTDGGSVNIQIRIIPKRK